jgi:hypothetical protein
MNDPIKALQLALAESGIDASDATEIVIYKDKAKNLWECSISTKESKQMEPGHIRVQVDERGARIVEMR